MGEKDRLDLVHLDDDRPNSVNDGNGLASSATTSICNGPDELVSAFLQIEIVSVTSNAVVGDVAFASVGVDEYKAYILIMENGGLRS